MNKKTILFAVSCCALFFIHSPIQGNTQSLGYSNLGKKSQRRARKRIRKVESASPVLDKQETKTITSLPQSCQNTEQLHFNLQPSKEDQKLCMFLNTVQFTKDGMSTFFSQTFNQKDYGSAFLPHNFSHLTQFMQYGKQTKQPHEYFDGVIRLFNQKLKTASYVNAAAFERMLTEITPYLAPLFPEEQLSLWKDLKRLMWTNFKDKFTFLRSDPMAFFEDISDQIVQKVKVDVTTPEKLRSVIMRFVGSGIDKLAWSPEDQKETWQSFKTIGQKIDTLYKANIINDPFDANELYWGLIERYCYFLELTGSALSLEVCQTMKQDIKTNKLKFLEMEEQEEGLETKRERLIQAFIETEAKVRIAKEGIITEILPHR